MEEYLRFRRLTGGVPPSFDLILLPLAIPEHVLEDPRIQALEDMANDLISVANVSYQSSCSSTP